MTRKEQIVQEVERLIEVRYATQNGAYKSGRTIAPVGCVNHSVGCAQPSAEVFFGLMNKGGAGWGVNALLGDFHKGPGRILLVLPLTCRPWGCGVGSKGSWNNTRIQWEVCEPSGHTYAGGTMIAYDAAKNADYFRRMWTLLVKWNVYCAVKIGYTADTINDHAESCRAGYGSNHADMGHWLPKHGKSMAALRAEVADILADNTNIETEEEPGMLRYERLSDIPEGGNFRNTIGAIMTAGILGGDGSDKAGNNDVIDLSHDMVRMFVTNSRAGIYDAAYTRAGLDPAKYK